MTRLTLPEAATSAGLHPKTLRDAISRGRLRAERYGRDWLTTDAWLQAYLASRRRGNFRTGAARGASLRYKREGRGIASTL